MDIITVHFFCRLTEMSAAKKTLEKEKEDEINNLTQELQEKSKSLDGIMKKNQTLADEITALRSRQADLNEVRYLSSQFEPMFDNCVCMEF